MRMRMMMMRMMVMMRMMMVMMMMRMLLTMMMMRMMRMLLTMMTPCWWSVSYPKVVNLTLAGAASAAGLDAASATAIVTAVDSLLSQAAVGGGEGERAAVMALASRAVDYTINATWTWQSRVSRQATASLPVTGVIRRHPPQCG
jgi:hypothetical protein